MNKSLERIDRKIVALVRQRIALTKSPDQRSDLLLAFITAVTHVSKEDIISTKRDWNTSDARCMYVYHLVELGYTRLAVAKMLNLDHAAVLYMLKKYKRQIETNDDFKDMVRELKHAWKGHLNTL
jgi:chromosomal replication initiation ATPase DnaA